MGMKRRSFISAVAGLVTLPFAGGKAAEPSEGLRSIQPGRCFHFDGTDDYISLNGAVYSYPFELTDVQVEELYSSGRITLGDEE